MTLARRVLGLCGRVYTCTVRGPQPSSTATAFHTSQFTQQVDKATPAVKNEDNGKKTQTLDRGDAPLGGIWQDFAAMDIAIPSKNTPDMMVDGVKFSELPICHVKCERNNTLITVTDHKGAGIKFHATCGMEGFRNAKKKTPVAAQATALALSQRAVKRGVQNVRVVLKGFGVGREAAVKGLTMGGLNVVSLTDETFRGYTGYRPRKQIKK